MNRGLFLLLAVSILFSCLTSEAIAVDIDFVELSFFKDHHNNAPLSESIYALPSYGFVVDVVGTGINNITIETPKGDIFNLSQESTNSWSFRDDTFDTSTTLFEVFSRGTYTFDFNSGEDQVSIAHNEDDPLGFAYITYPEQGMKNVPKDNVEFTWNSCIGYGERLRGYIKDETTGQRVYEHFGIPIEQTSMVAYMKMEKRHYYFGIDVENVTEGGMTTLGGDLFYSRNKFYYSNRVEFQTVPEPSAYLLSILAIGLLLIAKIKK